MTPPIVKVLWEDEPPIGRGDETDPNDRGVHSGAASNDETDPQLTRGFLMLPNRLCEALVAAGFTGLQLGIYLCLYRLSYGWQRHTTVRISCGELAKRLRSSLSGVRKALCALIAAGVIHQLETGSGRDESTFSVERDYTKWGAYRVSRAALAALYARRPEHNDNANSAVPGTTGRDAEKRPVSQRGLRTPDNIRLLGPRDGPRQKKISAADAKVRAHIKAIIPDEFHDDLAELETHAHNDRALYAELNALANGLRGARCTGGQIGQGIRDLVASGKASTYGLQQLRNYIRGAAWDASVTSAAGEPSNSDRAKPRRTTTERVRSESLENAQTELKRMGGYVSARRQRADGDEWWTRMIREAKGTHADAIRYAYARMHESGVILESANGCGG